MWSILNLETGEILYEDEFANEPSVIVGGIFYVKNQDGEYDIYNLSDVRTPINKNSFYNITEFDKSGYAIASLPGDPLCIIDKSANIIKELDKNIDCASGFSQGYALIKNSEEQWGLIDTKGNTVCKMKYDDIALNLNEGFIIATTTEKNVKTRHILDINGKELFKFNNTVYKDFNGFSNGYMPVQKEDKILFLNSKGEKAFSVGKNSSDYLPVNVRVNDDSKVVFIDGDKFGIANTEGNIIVRAKYDELAYVGKDRYIAKKQEKYGIINSKDEITLPFDYEILFDAGDVLIQKDGKNYSLINYEGKDVGTANFTELGASGGLAKSNYFNADTKAQAVINRLTLDTFWGKSGSYSVYDYSKEHEIYKYLLEGKKTDNAYEDGQELFFTFKGPIASEKYEYFYGYRLGGHTEINYNTKISHISMKVDVADYAITAEKDFLKSFNRQMKNKGFTENADGVMIAPNGNSAAVGYSDGTIVITYKFGGTLSKPERNARSKKAKKPTIDLEEVDSCLVDTVV